MVTGRRQTRPTLQKILLQKDLEGVFAAHLTSASFEIIVRGRMHMGSTDHGPFLLLTVLFI